LKGSIRCHRIVFASFFFGLATMTRTTGALLSVFVAYEMITKIFRTQNCCSIFKYLMCSWICALFILTPLLVIQYVKPYELHCDPKIDRTNAVPVWCLDALPNVYGYVQNVYWDNKFLSIIYRKWDTTLTSLPMFVIFFYFMIRVLK
jgi:Gpi18-like mannosyltransferase